MAIGRAVVHSGAAHPFSVEIKCKYIGLKKIASLEHTYASHVSVLPRYLELHGMKKL